MSPSPPDMRLQQPDPPQYYSPLDARAKLMHLQALAQEQQVRQQQLQLGQMDIGERQRQVAEGQQVRDVLRNSPDLRTALPGIYKINPTLGMSMTKSLHDQEKSALDMETARIGSNAAKAKRLASLAGSATDENSYHIAISKALDEGLMSPQEAQQHLTEGWGPQSQAQMQQAVQMGLTAEEQANQRLANLKEQREALDAQHKRDMEPFQLAEAQNTARKTGLEADELQRKLDMTKNTKVSDLLALVDNVVPPDVKANHALNLRTKFMVSSLFNQGDFAGAKDAIKTAAAEMRQLEVAGAGSNVLLSPAKEAQEIRISGERAAASPGLLDRESARFAKPHEKAVADANAQLEKINDARAMINGSAEAQALGIPKVLTALVSGAGSGVRITQPELNAIAKARGIAGGVEGFFNQIQGKGSLSKEQQRQVTQLLDDVADRIRQKQAIANDALDKINSAGSREDIVRIDSEARRKLGENISGSTSAKPATHRYNPATGKIEEIK